MMAHGPRKALGFALFAALLLVDFGCTGSDELVSESGTLSLEVVMSPVGSDRYEQALITLDQITFRPTDPVANTSLGEFPFGFLITPLQLTLLDTSPSQTSGIPLSDGQYQVEEVTLTNPTLTDSDPIVPPVTCLDEVLASSRTNGRLPPPEVNQAVVNSRIKVGPFSPPIVFSVPRLGVRNVRMTIDGPALVALFEAAFTCRSSGSCPSGSSSVAAPCMSGFTPITPAQAAALISFQ